MSFKPLTYRNYKQIAEEFLAQNPYGLTELPTNIEVLIGKSGYYIETEDNLFKDFGVKGLVAKHSSKDSYKIIIDLYHYEKQLFEYPFTLAEELAHIILHSHMYENITDIEEFIKKYAKFSDDDYKKYEQQAKNVACHLLLPQTTFQDYVLKWVDDNLTKLRKVPFSSKENLAKAISIGISKKLELSEYVISLTILFRYADLIIDSVLEKYGTTLLK